MKRGQGIFSVWWGFAQDDVDSALDPDPPHPRGSSTRLVGVVAVLLLPSVTLAVVGSPDERALSPVALYAAIGAVALLLNAIFTMAQTAIAATGPLAVEQLEEQEALSAKLLRRFLPMLPALEARFNAGAFLMLLVMCFSLTRAGMLAAPVAPTAGAVAGIVVALLLHLMLVEVIARSTALSNHLPTLKLIIPVAQTASFPLLPVIWFAAVITPSRPQSRHPAALSDMHLRLLPSLSGVDGVMEEETFDLIDSVRDFAELRAIDIMTPRTEVEGVPRDLPVADLYDRLRRTEYSRLVVYQGSIDTVVGVLLVKEVLLRRPEDPWTLLREPLVADEQTRLPELLAMIRKHRTHLVLLFDEFGGMSGIVTLHDLFETIVGHIDDVEDEDELWIQELSDGTFLLNGRVELWEVNEELGLALNEDAARTISGLVFNTFGSVTEVGDAIDIDGVHLSVAAMDENRIDAVRVSIGNREETMRGGNRS